MCLCVCVRARACSLAHLLLGGRRLALRRRSNLIAGFCCKSNARRPGAAPPLGFPRAPFPSRARALSLIQATAGSHSECVCQAPAQTQTEAPALALGLGVALAVALALVRAPARLTSERTHGLAMDATRAAPRGNARSQRAKYCAPTREGAGRRSRFVIVCSLELMQR